MVRQNSAAALERAAVRLFAKYGFVGTSMRDLASEVGVSTANIYNHTSSKEEMLWKIISRTMGDLLVNAARAEAASTCPVGQLEAFMSAHVTYHATHRGEARIGNTQWRHLSDERMQVVHSQRDQYTQALESIIDRGSSGAYFRQPQGKFATLSLIAMGLGVSQWYRSTGSHTPEQIAAVYLEFALDVLRLDGEFHNDNCIDPGHTQVPVRATAQPV